MALNNLRSRGPKVGKLIPIVLNQFPGDPILHCEHLGSTNQAFMADSLRSAGTEAVRSSKTISMEEIAINRIENRKTVAQFSVRKLEGFYYDDADGGRDLSRPVPSTPEGIAEVVDALSDADFDIVLTMVRNLENFRDAPVAKPEDVAKK